MATQETWQMPQKTTRRRRLEISLLDYPIPLGVGDGGRLADEWRSASNRRLRGLHHHQGHERGAT
jgi:hypothetical protein